MRPPEFTGGNQEVLPKRRPRPARRFNEAAGIHRRKRAPLGSLYPAATMLQ